METQSKRPYFVSVSGKAVESASSHSEHLEIMATPKEVDELQLMLDRQHTYDTDTVKNAPIPFKSADHDPANTVFNDKLKELYYTIYRLGTPKTRDHIRSMDILEELEHPDYNHPGYEK
ncbi:hypothetical protein IDH44_25180 [Paenibacillus sp. IB182496]|uniref:Hydrolase n=1 Tax=Paenibacillus sabuli TaxID=2772509 RepID=A0A927GU30_9BACL|nr:hypothetical protein [Paenibacillus sabuli]MBD2848489.1 hypothetical protein [Paenibacillus sabuli]